MNVRGLNNVNSLEKHVKVKLDFFWLYKVLLINFAMFL